MGLGQNQSGQTPRVLLAILALFLLATTLYLLNPGLNRDPRAFADDIGSPLRAVPFLENEGPSNGRAIFNPESDVKILRPLHDEILLDKLSNPGQEAPSDENR